MSDLVLANARLVLDTEVVPGSLHVEGGTIRALDTGTAVPKGAVDCAGDLVLPGLIELHTDNLERHLRPRPKVDWPRAAAITAHDAELASVGITTVFDALRVGFVAGERSGGQGGPYARDIASRILARRQGGALRISHFLHLRAELCSETLAEELEAFGADDRVGLLSLMDHLPGARQFRDMDKYRTYAMGKHGFSEAEYEAHVERLFALHARMAAGNERAAVAAGRRLGAVLASHDDTSPEQVAASAAHGVRLAEFPTTRAAAQACRDHDIPVMMGAPNLVRGGSHSGNVAAAELARDGLLDALSSDYVPAALLMGALRLGRQTGDLAAGIATVTRAPAAAVGLGDRGRLAPGLRGDLVRLALVPSEGDDGGDEAVIRGVWVRGARVG